MKKTIWNLMLVVTVMAMALVAMGIIVTLGANYPMEVLAIMMFGFIVYLVSKEEIA